jgi:uncharacterized integral membrane protein
MSAVKWILIVVFFLIVLLFAIQNQEKVASVGFLHWVWLNVSVYWIAYAAFVAGFAMTLLLFGYSLLKMKSRTNRLQKENKKIMEELNHMRNASIDEDFNSAEADRDEEVERKMPSRKKR